MAESHTQAAPLVAAQRPQSMSPLKVWLIVLLLLLVGIVNYVDRLLPAVLAEPIRLHFSLSDGALGFINGFGFLVVYAAASIPMAKLADRGYHGRVIVASLVAWSGMTMLGAFASSAWQLAIARMGVALGEAGAIPASHAFITRNMPQANRASALAVFTLCLPLGVMAGHAAGGLLGEKFGWQNTFLIMGVAGLALALIAAIVIPSKKATDSMSIETGEEEVHEGRQQGIMLLLRRPSFVAMLSGAACMGAGGYAAGTFIPAFLMRSHGLTVGQAGAQYGIAAGVFGIIGLLATGWVADRLSRRDQRWVLGVVIIVTAAFLPISYLSFSLRDTTIAVLALAMNPALTNFYVAPVITAMHQIAPYSLRARASAMMVIASSLSGGVGALAAGLLSDALTPRYGAEALGHALLIIPVFYTLGVLCFVIALRRFRSDLAWASQRSGLNS